MSVYFPKKLNLNAAPTSQIWYVTNLKANCRLKNTKPSRPLTVASSQANHHDIPEDASCTFLHYSDVSDSHQLQKTDSLFESQKCLSFSLRIKHGANG